MKKNIINICVALVISFIAIIVICWGLFGQEGFYRGYAISLDGGDDVSFLSEIKSLLDGSSYLCPDKLGAPFGTDRTTSYSYYLFNDVHLLTYIWAIITGNLGKAQWLTSITLMFLNFISAYVVLLLRKINPYVSVGGALLFAFQYYFRARIVGHIMLMALWTIPLYILLCLWIIDDNEYLKFDKSFFFNKKNIGSLIISALVINSGIGYYPFFGCMLIVLTGIMKSIYYRKSTGIIQMLKQIVFIGVFEIINLSYFLYSIISKGNTISMQPKNG